MTKQPYLIAGLVVILPYVFVAIGKLIRPKERAVEDIVVSDPQVNYSIISSQEGVPRAANDEKVTDAPPEIEIPVSSLDYFTIPGTNFGKIGKKSQLAKDLKLSMAELSSVNEIVVIARKKLQDLEVANASIFEDPTSKQQSVVIEPFSESGGLIRNNLSDEICGVLGEVRGNLAFRAIVRSFEPMGQYSLHIPLDNSIVGESYRGGDLFGEIRDGATRIEYTKFGGSVLKERIAPIIEALLLEDESN